MNGAANLANPDTKDIDPSFEVVQWKNLRIVLVLDVSGSMGAGVRRNFDLTLHFILPLPEPATQEHFLNIFLELCFMLKKMFIQHTSRFLLNL